MERTKKAKNDRPKMDPAFIEKVNRFREDLKNDNLQHYYVDYTNYPVLKELYREKFRVGIACEANSHFGGFNPMKEIGNRYKEDLMRIQFNSMTFGNELKPESNMGFRSEKATEDYLPFDIAPSAKEMLDWAVANHMNVRGHVLVWHSQCPNEVFCKKYVPVYTDEEKHILDESCLVEREVMLKRMQSYIDSTMEYMYQNGYAKTIYAWDVVNEAVEDEFEDNPLRNSYWYKTIGEDFIYFAFKYAKEAVIKYSLLYAKQYKIDVNDENELKKIQPKLFYNDYNEWIPKKRDAIIHIITQDFAGHNIKAEGLLDGIGMQGHLSDTNDVDEYITALNMYDAAAPEVQITELDVNRTGSDVNADYYQALFYNRLFRKLIEAVDRGVNLTCVTIWGLTDDLSWKRAVYPLLFNHDLSRKLAFDGVVDAITGGDLGEPAPIVKLDLERKVNYKDRNAMNSVKIDVSDYRRQTISFTAKVKSSAKSVCLYAFLDQEQKLVTEMNASSDEWIELSQIYKVPSDPQTVQLCIQSSDRSDVEVDDVTIKLLGMDEHFDEDTFIAAPRGVGHMPFVMVVPESRNENGHSYMVVRNEIDATMSFDVSSYIGENIHVSAFVNTSDKKIRLGFDGTVPELINEVDAIEDEWTKITGTYHIPEGLNAARMYIETEGIAKYMVGDIQIRIC